MFRLLAGENSMVFTDPDLNARRILSFIVPDALTVPFANLWEQFSGGGSVGANFTNAVTGLIAGFVAGANLQKHGTSLVETSGGLGLGTNLLTDPNVDVKRATFNAAFHATESDFLSRVVSVSLVTGVTAALALDAIVFIPSTIPLKFGIGFATACSLGPSVIAAFVAGMMDLKESHNMPLMWEHQNTWRQSGDVDGAVWGKGNKITSIGSAPSVYDPYLMEDFLYERPFLNLALNDLHTLDSLQKNSNESIDFSKLIACLKSSSTGKRSAVRDSVLNEVSSLTKYKEQIKDMLSDSCMNINSCLDSRLSSFVSSRVASLNRNCYYIGSRDSVKCAVGLFAKKGNLNSTLWKQSASALTPLKFHSESDWSKMGMKMDRWERVPGLRPDGTPDDTLVPIRHVERYEVPMITVEDWIDKYSFVVDDLMPHRLRQIRMNFNFQEEIAWECDVSKALDADDACKVYRRTGSGNWINPIVIVDSVETESGKVERKITIDKVPHPVKKNGQFDFIPDDYGIENKLAIQKDNQNTVTISMVNKIGLSNTQRFYYMFKATKNKLDPVWPMRDVVVNKIKNFKAYASALGYQGFSVIGADDIIIPQFGSDSAQSYMRQNMDMSIDWFIDMSRIGQADVDSTGKVYDKSSAYFASKQNNSDPQEGDYLWKFYVDIDNIAARGIKDSSNTYEVPFRVDRTAPEFTLKAEHEFINPDSSSFVARFAWGDTAGVPDIRAMRLSLERALGNIANPTFTWVADFPALSDVASKEFAIQWNNVTRDTVRNHDGLYRIKAYAVDYAVPDLTVLNKMDSLVVAIMRAPGNVSSSLWPIDADSVNSAVVYGTFFVDTKAPEISDFSMKGLSTGSTEYSRLSRPSRSDGYAYATEDSLLNITYKITEPLNGLDSVPVTIAWSFIHQDDPTKADRAGDSLWIKSDAAVEGSWTEMAGLRLEDGDYKIRAVVRDQAKNVKDSLFEKKLRVDKTAPNIESLVSTQLVYPETVKKYSAKIVVNENNDVKQNRSGMHCHYRVSGSNKTTSWKRISNKTLKNDSLTFSLDSIGFMHGTCYLEAVCIDAAGNATVKTDLFYMGERTPVISSPRDSANYNSLVAITGIAPPVRLADSLNTVYRLRYAKADTSTSEASLKWETANIFVVAALQNDSLRHISKMPQSNDAVLGYLDRNLGNGSYLEGMFMIELGTCAGQNCIGGSESLWKTDRSLVFLGANQDEFFGDSLEPHVVKNCDTVLIDSNMLEVSLALSGRFNGSYSLRLYAKDSKNVGVFDESVSKVWRNPYYGKPNETLSDSSAIWFYEQDGKYHLQWNGLATGDSLLVSYNSAGFGKTCESPKGNYANCSIRPIRYNITALSPMVNSQFENLPELLPLSTVNHEMLVTGKTGHLVMTATEAFRISRLNAFDSTLPKMHVYFGNNVEDGFYWITEGRVSSDTLSPFMTGWTVDPHAYGLKFRWNGMMESGAYPAVGKMKIYAEITENVTVSPHVFLDSTTVEIKLPKVRVILPDTLPDFILSKKDSVVFCKSSTVTSDSCDKKLIQLNAMIAKYGIKYRDAKVKILIKDGAKEIATLQDSVVIVRANSNDSAYRIRWNGKRNDGLAEMKEYDYTLKINAWPTDTSNADSAEAFFRVKYAETMYDVSPKNPKNEKDTVPSIYVSEAVEERSNPGVYRYEPVADYLVKANIGGWKLPDTSLANGIPLVGEISGRQEIYKYEPKRFSLAIRRHRKELKLVALAMLDVHSEQMTQVIGIGDYCESANHRSDTVIYSKTLSYDSENLSDSLRIYHHAYRQGTFWGQPIQFKYGYDNNMDYLTHVDVIVLMERTLIDQLKGRDVSSLTAKDFKDLKQSTEIIWKLSDYLDSNGTSGWNIPIPNGNVVHDTSIVTSKNENCKITYVETEFADRSCVYGTEKLEKTPNYNPNANLFNVDIYRTSDYFYKDYGRINDDCKEKRWKEMDFYIKLTIPKEYWDAPFGMDNLVNRTIRFDHTNKTIFGDSVSGYWNALKNSKNAIVNFDASIGSYYDGNVWKYDSSYGLLTPFEVQYLPMYPASLMDGGVNTFLFADEDKDHQQSARLDLHFYGPKNDHDFFHALVVNTSLNTYGCDVVVDGTNLKRSGLGGNCLVYARSNNDTVKNTPYYPAGTSAKIFVSRNLYAGRNVIGGKAEKDTSIAVDTIAYPASLNWREQITDSCIASGQSWDFASDGGKPCYKYYDFGSRVHYYYGDYTDSVWMSKFVNNNGFLKNLVNSPEIAKIKPLDSFFRDSLDASKFGTQSVEVLAVPSSDDYDPINNRFFINLDTVPMILSNLTKDHVAAKIASLKVDRSKLSAHDSIVFSAKNDTLYIKADSLDMDIIYRKSVDAFAKTPVRPNSETLSMNRLLAAESLYVNYDKWYKNVVVNSANLVQLDSSDHTHLKISGDYPSSMDMRVEFRPADSIKVKRPKELVELHAYLKDSTEYQLAYLNGDAFYAVPNSMLDSRWKKSIKARKSGWYRLGWFDVNKLQGNTQFMLLWGDANKTSQYFAMFDMIVGRSVDPSDYKTVKSLFEEVSVTFPENSVNGQKDITVRTIDAKDYPFEVFNNLALKGPIIEVLPSMTFANESALPRVQMKISREEMRAMNATPQTVRLYKIDTTSKKFVPLDHALYGFLNADGSAVMENGDTLKCDDSNKMTKKSCAGRDSLWAYLFISAETHTFSVFTAMDSAIAETPQFSVTVVPEIASAVNRIVRIDGLSRYQLYVDDDSLWSNRGDTTPPNKLVFTADSNGFAQVTLPSRGQAIDTSYVFVVALGEPDADGNMDELPAAPAKARALTVNTPFACSVPADSLWLGLDNGYLAYGASCTHPGYGVVTLYRNGRVVAETRGEIPDTIYYDGSKTSGKPHVGKIAKGTYESRYVGVSAIGLDVQMAGPKVYTDSARPLIRNFSVQESSEVLDRLFTVTAKVADSESGIARVIVVPVFGEDTLRVLNLLPDTSGVVKAVVRATRKQLSECTGCKLSIEMRVEDYGHNRTEQKFDSEKLYPYPTELALWYPAREDGGNIAHEFLGTGHDLDLTGLKNPWQSDVGLYFDNKLDYAAGNGLVDFGSKNSYSFEARIKNGYAKGLDWHRILGFKGISGQEISLELRNRSLRLVEGSRIWGTGAILPSEKSWAHIAVTVDSVYVRFYVNGELKAERESGINMDRELEGSFSMGRTGELSSYIGNIADIRMYSRVLTAAEVEELSKPVTDAGEVSDVIVVAVKDMDVVNGFTNEFSCSVAGNKYLVSGDSAVLNASVIVGNAADYNIVLYARSVNAGEKVVSIGESSLISGMATVSNVWRAVTISGMKLPLSAGSHTLKLKVPAGIQIGGLALTTANIPASMIAWGVSTADKVAGITSIDTTRKVKSYLRYEGYPETSTLRPRIRLRNVSNEPVNGFSVRYYFRGEDASQASVERYWPNNVSTTPSVHSESANTGFVEWKFVETIPVAGTIFSGDGPHFGLYNSGNVPWNAVDDPSFVDANSGVVSDKDGFYEDVGVIVLDRDNNLIGGSCVEMEDPISLESKARVMALDMRDDNQASEIHFKVENTGNVPLKNYDVRYYFFVEEGLAPDFEIYDKFECSSVAMENNGAGRWQVNVHCDKSLAAGKMWTNPVKVGLHLSGWSKMWNAKDDPSHDSLGTSMRDARGICVFDSNGHMIYGMAPVWPLPSPDEIGSDSVYNVDFGYQAPGNSIPITRTPEGLVVSLNSWMNVELSLVSAMGVPVKTIFNGQLAPGEQFIRVDWTGIDMNKTYLMLKVNGNIRSTKKLSML